MNDGGGYPASSACPGHGAASLPKNPPMKICGETGMRLGRPEPAARSTDAGS